MDCPECKIQFDGFKNKMYRSLHCQSCYSRLNSEGKFKRQKEKFCSDCGVEFNENNISSHVARCKKCFGIWSKIKRLNADLCVGCKKPNSTKGDYCKLCRKAAAGKFKLNIPPTEVTKKGKIKIPNDIKLEVIKLLIRWKNKMISPTDYYLAAHLYLTIFNWDAELDSYGVESQVEYMISVMKNLIRQS